MYSTLIFLLSLNSPLLELKILSKHSYTSGISNNFFLKKSSQASWPISFKSDCPLNLKLSTWICLHHHSRDSFHLSPILYYPYPVSHVVSFVGLLSHFSGEHLPIAFPNGIWKVKIFRLCLSEHTFGLRPYLIGSLARYRILSCKQFFFRTFKVLFDCLSSCQFCQKSLWYMTWLLCSSPSSSSSSSFLNKTCPALEAYTFS